MFKYFYEMIGQSGLYFTGVLIVALFIAPLTGLSYFLLNYLFKFHLDILSLITISLFFAGLVSFIFLLLIRRSKNKYIKSLLPFKEGDLPFDDWAKILKYLHYDKRQALECESLKIYELLDAIETEFLLKGTYLDETLANRLNNYFSNPHFL